MRCVSACNVVSIRLLALQTPAISRQEVCSDSCGLALQCCKQLLPLLRRNTQGNAPALPDPSCEDEPRSGMHHIPLAQGMMHAHLTPGQAHIDCTPAQRTVRLPLRRGAANGTIGAVGLRC